MTDNDQVYLDLADEMKRRIELKLPLLDMVMPNGKPTRDCTGHEMKEFGQRLSRIGKKQLWAQAKLNKPGRA